MSVAVKICGISDPIVLKSVVKGGAEYIGLIFYDKSPRFVSLEQAVTISGFCPDNIKVVGLFVNPSDTDIEPPCKYAWLDMVQLHGNEPPERVKEIKEKFGVKVIKAINISSPEDIALAPEYEDCADMILFDAKTENGIPGGNGKIFDWNLLKGYKGKLPWALSGGLNKDNILHALEVLSPDIIDLSSGVEIEKGIKSPEKIREFFDILRTSGKFRPTYIRVV